ncbi:MAG: DCC1-like thiol-disulfide oxidoreductase family protein [Methylococcaceae bacterium]
MLKRIKNLVEQGFNQQVSATGLGVFRILFGLVIVHEILFLIAFRHLIFDTLPYIDKASPVLHYFLVAWAGVAVCLTVGYQTRWMSLWNYLFWVIFVVFTPMWQDFDGGFDQFMTGSSFLLLFLPADRALSLDHLLGRLQYSPVFRPETATESPRTVSILAYNLPIAIALGLLYLDSGLHKVSSEFWRNGLGAWLPPTMPYYMSGLDMSWLLDQEWIEKTIGYSIIGFQWIFLFLFWFKPFRLPLMLIGASFHGGIILSLNIYPFGFGMLVHYALMVPFGFWSWVSLKIRCKQPKLLVFYDEQCPLCNRTAIIIDYFDIRRAIGFRGVQTHREAHPQLATIPLETLLKDLYCLDSNGILRQGVNTYSQILKAMGYPALLGWLMALPGVYQLAEWVYRRIADNRSRVVCDAQCALSTPPAEYSTPPFSAYYARYAATRAQQVQRVSKFLVLILLLQFNSTVHYALVYRWAEAIRLDPALSLLDHMSDAVINVSHTFLGITPHALYMHDHFAGYTHLLGITWFDGAGQEHWLPFIDETGRLVEPNWGRVQSMWANVAVTSQINSYRLEKLLSKVTAYYAHELSIPLDQARFGIKLKEIRVPMEWEPGLRHHNMAAPWRDIGVMNWQNGKPQLLITEVDLERLTRNTR